MGTKKKKNNGNDDAVVIPLDLEDEIEEYEKAPGKPCSLRAWPKGWGSRIRPG